MNRLHTRAVWLFFINFLIRWFFIALVIAAWASGVIISIFEKRMQTEEFNAFITAVIIIAALLLIFCYIWAWFSWHFYRYELTEDGFKKEYGVIRKRYVTIPYDRIQNIDIYRGLIARLLGLSELQIQTAGAVMVAAEGRLPGLAKDVAERLREELVQRQKRTVAGRQGL